MKHRLIFVFVLFLCLAGFGSEPAPASKETRKLSVSTVDIENPGLYAATAIMTEAYSRMGMQIKVVRLPAQRALPDANSGQYDAELYRVAAIAADYPNLKRVPTSIGSIDFVAYGKRSMLGKISDWQSLKPFRLGAQLGIKFIEYNTRGMNVGFVSKGEQLVQMLHMNRIDVILMDRNTMLETQKRMKNTADKALLDEIVEIKLLNQQALYHYVHRKNENLIPLIDSTLKAMKKEGFIKKSWDDVKI